MSPLFLQIFKCFAKLRAKFGKLRDSRLINSEDISSSTDWFIWKLMRDRRSANIALFVSRQSDLTLLSAHTPLIFSLIISSYTVLTYLNWWGVRFKRNVSSYYWVSAGEASSHLTGEVHCNAPVLLTLVCNFKLFRKTPVAVNNYKQYRCTEK